MSKTFHVYILASESRVLYTGATSNLVGRTWQHKQGRIAGFTQRYNVKKLVWFGAHGGPTSAIAREKQIKGWLRARKIALIEATNPRWEDLSAQLR